MFLVREGVDLCNNSVQLPCWIDTFIFDQLGGTFHKNNDDMTVIDWGPKEIRNYLGTYFPRSYAESYCIFRQVLTDTKIFINKKKLSILDFGCGTGGELFGFASALAEMRPKIESIKVKAIDGNQYALNRFDDIREEFNKIHTLHIKSNPSAIYIEDFYDLNILDSIIDKDYDVILSFKAVCEFVTKQQFEEKNAYEYLLNFMIPRLSENGIMLLVDVSTKNSVSKEWLPDMMDKGLAASEASIIARNQGYNESFIVSHTRQRSDVSKIAWRLICKNGTKNKE